MAKKVKCAVTGEYGLSGEYIKINGRYYKNQQIYDADKRKKDVRKQLIEHICVEYLGYSDGQPFPPILPKKLKELEFYDNEIILETFRQKANDIRYALNTKQFNNDFGRVSYMFAVVKNSIADVKKQFDYQNRQEQAAVKNIQAAEDIAGTKNTGKDITAWLEEES